MVNRLLSENERKMEDTLVEKPSDDLGTTEDENEVSMQTFPEVEKIDLERARYIVQGSIEVN